MHHGMRYFDASRKTVENESADFGFENRDQISKLVQVLFCAMYGCSQVAFEGPCNRQNLLPARVLHKEGCRTKDLRVQV